MSHHYEKAPGKLITPTTATLTAFVLLAFAIIGYRFLSGLGAVSGMSNGYPWGIWLAYDVSVGTAFACGGYALAIICYVLNGWKYHPMIRSAVVGSMFGYALAGLSVMVDIGRYWNAYYFFVPPNWQTNSVLFEVAVCVMAYTVVLMIEFCPSMLEGLKGIDQKSPALQAVKKIAEWAAPRLDKVLLLFVILGITLPTMHQSSLGSLFIITGKQLHPLWQTPFLPLLFVSNAVLMGFAIVLFESGLSAAGFNRPFEKEALDFAKLVPYIGFFWIAVRLLDLVVRGVFMGQLNAMLASPFHVVMFAIEIVLVTWTVFRCLGTQTPRKAFFTGFWLCLGGGLYRMNVYLTGFNPGKEWQAYFPTIPEFFISFGFIALEVLAYILLVRLLKLLPVPHKAH